MIGSSARSAKAPCPIVALSGHVHWNSVTAVDGTPHINKLEFGCFNNEGFCAAAKKLPGHRNTMLVCGMESHICVTQTVLGALGKGYQVHLASDAVGSRTEANCRVGLARMERAGALLSSAEMAIYELIGRSDSAAFKQMLPYLKS